MERNIDSVLHRGWTLHTAFKRIQWKLLAIDRSGQPPVLQVWRSFTCRYNTTLDCQNGVWCRWQLLHVISARILRLQTLRESTSCQACPRYGNQPRNEMRRQYDSLLFSDKVTCGQHVKNNVMFLIIYHRDSFSKILPATRYVTR